MKKIKVGFLPNSTDFKHPQDRRRYVPFLDDLNIEPEVAIFKNHYEILYVSLNCDLNQWSKYKKFHEGKNTRIIFDLSDNYLADSFLNSVLRSIAHFMTGKTKSFIFDYRTSIKNMLEVSDVVTVGSIEQKEYVSEFHSDVRIIRDFFADEIKDVKKNFFNIDKRNLNVMWEGLSHGSEIIFRDFRKVAEDIKENFDSINLHVVTDCKICLFLGKLFCKPSEKVLTKIFSNTNVKVFFYNWTIENLHKAADLSDLAIIPIPKKPFMMSKPENKLLLFWSLGIPVVVSDTPSYSRVMLETENEDFLCKTNNNFSTSIVKLSSDASIAEDYYQRARKYIQVKLSRENIFQTWSSIFFND